jgi:hypothetical protein
MKQIVLFLLFISFLYVYSLNEIIFNSNNAIKNITSEKDIFKKCKKCSIFYNNLVNNNYVCIYEENNDKINNTINEFHFFNEIINIYSDEILLIKNDIIYFLNNNNNKIKEIKKIFDSFYLFTNKSINKLFKNLILIIFDRFILFLDKFYLFIEKNLKLDTDKEEIILPFPQKIRYFTNITIDKYFDCDDFLESLKDSTCFLTDKKRILNFIRNIINNI